MTTGTIDTGWSGGALNHGTRGYRQWSGADRSAADKAAGQFPPHAYSTTRLSMRYPKVWAVRSNFPLAEVWFADTFGLPPYPTDPWTTNDWNKLINKLYSKVKGSDFNAAVFTSQLGQTLGGITDAALRIAKAWKLARRGKFGSASVALTGKSRGPRGKLASNWLELQYGWLPLLGDVNDAMELIANQRYAPKFPTIRVRSFKANETVTSTNVAWAFSQTLHREQILYTPSEALTFTEILGLNDPYSVVWENLPYSFVLDWFLPIGPWLEAASAARTLRGSFVHTTTVVNETKGASGKNGWTILGSDVSRKNVTVNRELLTNLTPKYPSWKPFAVAMDPLTRCLNALALLSNLKR